MNKGLRETPKTPPTNDAYRDNYDAIFRRPKSTELDVLPIARGTEDLTEGGTDESQG